MSGAGTGCFGVRFKVRFVAGSRVILNSCRVVFEGSFRFASGASFGTRSRAGFGVSTGGSSGVGSRIIPPSPGVPLDVGR